MTATEFIDWADRMSKQHGCTCGAPLVLVEPVVINAPGEWVTTFDLHHEDDCSLLDRPNRIAAAWNGLN